MKLLFFLIYFVMTASPEENYAKCLWNNCMDLRTQCGLDCYEASEVVTIKQSSEYCLTGSDRVLYYKTCAELIVNATTNGTVQSYYKCLASCFSQLLSLVILIYAM